MNNLTRHVGMLEIIDRLPSSRYGNPRWLVRVDGWTARTTPDSSLAYSITNHTGKRVVAHIGTYYGKATVRDVRRATAED